MLDLEGEGKQVKVLGVHIAKVAEVFDLNHPLGQEDGVTGPVLDRVSARHEIRVVVLANSPVLGEVESHCLDSAVQEEASFPGSDPRRINPVLGGGRRVSQLVVRPDQGDFSRLKRCGSALPQLLLPQRGPIPVSRDIDHPRRTKEPVQAHLVDGLHVG